MTFHAAVKWFQNLGALVEPGPRRGEVTLLWEERAPDGTLESQTTQVVPDDALAEMAKISRDANLRNRLNGHAAGYLQ